MALLLTSGLLMIAFVLAERYRAAPMFDLSLFGNPGFVGVSVAMFAIAAGMFAMYPYLTLYLQNDLWYSPLIGGLCLLPSTLLCGLIPIAARRAIEQLPARVMLSAGLLASATGLALMRGLTVHSSWTTLIPGLVLTGVGIGIANLAIAKTALGVVPPQRAGIASGVSNTVRTADLATGVAALGAIFQHHLATSLAAQLGHPAARLAKALAAGGTHAAQSLAPAQHDLLAASRHAFVSGINEILAIGSIVVFLGSLAALALVRARDLHQTPNPVPRDPDPALTPIAT